MKYVIITLIGLILGFTGGQVYKNYQVEQENKAFIEEERKQIDASRDEPNYPPVESKG